MGPKTPEVPGPTKGQKRFEASQADALDTYMRNLEQQNIESRMLQPLFFNELGFDPSYKDVDKQIAGSQLASLLGIKGNKATKAGIDPSSLYSLEDALGFAGDDENKKTRINTRFETINPTKQLTGLTKRAPSQADTARSEIEKLSLDRELAALKGDLPVNPALLRDLDKQQRTLEENMMKRLGSGWATSTPGQQGQQAFDIMRNTILENARRGDLTLADALQSGALGNRLGQQGQMFGLSGATSQMPFGNIGGFAQASQGYGQMAQSAAQQRLAQYQMAQGMGGDGGIGGAMGSLGGLFSGGGGMNMFSGFGGGGAAAGAGTAGSTMGGGFAGGASAFPNALGSMPFFGG